MSVTVEKCMQAWTNSLKQMNAKADIVFFGDSLTYYGDFASEFPDKVVCNLGLRGDTIQGMIDRVEQVRMLEPENIYLMTGINDLITITTQKFEKQYSSLIHTIREVLPKSELIIQGLLPVNDIDFAIKCSNKEVIKFNKIILKIAETYNLYYLDLFSIYAMDGILNKEYTFDGIHLKKDVYKKWYIALKANI